MIYLAIVLCLTGIVWLIVEFRNSHRGLSELLEKGRKLREDSNSKLMEDIKAQNMRNIDLEGRISVLESRVKDLSEINKDLIILTSSLFDLYKEMNKQGPSVEVPDVNNFKEGL